MTEIDTTAAPQSEAALRSWLIGRVAQYVEQPADQIDPQLSITSYGLDSVYAFALCGEIESRLGVPIEPDVLWELDTVAALTTHLMSRLARTTGPRPR